MYLLVIDLLVAYVLMHCITYKDDASYAHGTVLLLATMWYNIWEAVKWIGK